MNAPATPKKRLFTPRDNDSAPFLVYTSIAIGLAMGLFPIGPLLVLSLLAWVFVRNLHLLSFTIFVIVFLAANMLGVPPRHEIGALVLDNGPEGLFTAFATNPILSLLRLHEYETMGAFVLVAIAKLCALIAAKPLAKRYWPEHQGPAFFKGRMFSLRNIVLLPLALVLIAALVLVLAPSIARDAVKNTIAAKMGNDAEVNLDEVSFSIFDAQLTIKGLEVFESKDKGGKRMLGIETLSADANLMAILSNRLEVNLATADGIYVAPALVVKAFDDGKEAAGAPAKPAIELPPLLLDLSNEIKVLSEKPFVKDFQELYALYQEHFGDAKKPEEAPQVHETISPRAPAYIEAALAKIGAPLMVVRETSISNFKLSFDGMKNDAANAANHYLATGVKITNLSTEPAKFGQVISMTGEMNLDTSADRAVQFTASYAPNAAIGESLASLSFKGLNLPIPSLINGLAPGAPSLTLSLGKSSAGLGAVAVGIAFPFNEASNDAGVLGIKYSMPTSEASALFGVGIHADNLPLAKVSSHFGNLPFGIDDNARATFSTYGSQGEIAYFGDSKEKIGIALGTKGLKLTPKEGEKVLGLSSSRFCQAFNSLTTSSSGNSLMLRFGYGGADGAFRLEEPRERALLDGIINAVALGASDLADWEAAEFEGKGTISLTSMANNGSKRTLEVQPSVDDGLGNVRVRVNIGALKVKKANESVIGMPPNVFQNVWNRAVGDDGLKGVLGFRLTDENGKLSPKIESGSYPTLVYALLGGFNYKLQDFAPGGKVGDAVFRAPLPFQLLPPESWDGTQLPAPEGPGLANLTVRALWDDPRLYPEDQPKKIFGLPAAQVTYVWNNYVKSHGDKIEVAFRLYDDAGNFSPSPDIDFKSLFSGASEKGGYGDLFSDPAGFLKKIASDPEIETQYMNFLSRNEARIPGFSGSDASWLKDKLTAVGRGEEIKIDTTGILPKDIVPGKILEKIIPGSDPKKDETPKLPDPKKIDPLKPLKDIGKGLPGGK